MNQLAASMLLLSLVAAAAGDPAPSAAPAAAPARAAPPQTADAHAKLLRQANEAEEHERWHEAIACRRQLVALAEAAHGADGWPTGEARVGLQRIEGLTGMSPETRKRLAEALRQVAAAAECAEKGTLLDGRRLAQQSVAVHEEVWGNDHVQLAAPLQVLSGIEYRLGDLTAAEAAVRRTLRLLEPLGRHHPEYLGQLSGLGQICQARGDYAAAEPLLRQALDSALAGGVAAADLFGHLNNLAGLYLAIGDLQRAEPLLERAKELAQKSAGEKHAAYADALNNLGGLYYAAEDYARAEPLLRAASELRKQLHGDASTEYAASLNNLAGLCQATGRNTEAELLYRESLRIRKSALGERHPDYAEGLNNLASLCHRSGDGDKAAALLEQANAIYAEVWGKQHPLYARGLNNLAAIARDRGDLPRAAALYRQSLEGLQASVATAIGSLSERQQRGIILAYRQTLDGYLAIAPRLPAETEAIYRHVLRWKGLGFAEQRRQQAAAERPEAAARLAELQRTSAALAAMALAVPSADGRAAWQAELQQLSQRKERLEAELAGLARGLAARAAIGPAELQSALPPESVLVDFVQFDAPPQPGSIVSPGPRLLAFIIRRSGPVRLVDLGPADPIGQGVTTWRKNLHQGVAGSQEASKALRQAVWTPVEKAIGTLPPLVLLSADGPLARVPFAALPGRSDDRFLIEECGLVLVPAPQALPELLASASPASGPARLLVVGDVDYDGQPQPPAATRGLSRGADFKFAPLPNTRGEMLALRDSFEGAFPDGRVVTLRGTKATEEAVRSAVAGCRYLHMATHGFFLPPAATARHKPGESATMAVLHPGLTSGLALAGANLPPAAAGDALLTADEVATLPLGSLELAVMSACDTGLGVEARGEGLLGLQRAFQVAGARTVLASLWKVDDEATRSLMERFYENLWSGKLSRLESLRQAQIWMIRQSPTRGFVLVPQGPQVARPKFSPPYYWAAFVLSGDWR